MPTRRHTSTREANSGAYRLRRSYIESIMEISGVKIPNFCVNGNFSKCNSHLLKLPFAASALLLHA